LQIATEIINELIKLMRIIPKYVLQFI